MGYVIINDSHVMTADEAKKKREMEAFVYLSSEKKSQKNHQLKKFFFGREKSIFHNYFPLIDKSKYWHHVSLLLVWRGDNSQVELPVNADPQRSNERWKITFLHSWLDFFFPPRPRNIRKSYLKHFSTWPKQWALSTPFEWKEINFLLLLKPCRAESILGNSSFDKQTNKQDAFTRI